MISVRKNSNNHKKDQNEMTIDLEIDPKTKEYKPKGINDSNFNGGISLFMQKKRFYISI